MAIFGTLKIIIESLKCTEVDQGLNENQDFDDEYVHFYGQ